MEQSISNSEAPKALSNVQKFATAIGFTGLFILFLSLLNVHFPYPTFFFILSLVLITTGVVIFSNNAYLGKDAGVKNDGVWFKSMSAKGAIAWGTGLFLTAFYVVLYWFPELLGQNPDGANSGLIALFDPLSRALNSGPASQWFVYGTLYSLAILIFGYKFILKYRHSKYHIIRTISVIFFQLGFAFLIPEILLRLNQPYYSATNLWPLNWDFWDYEASNLLSSGTMGLVFFAFAVLSIFVLTPILTYKYGKRWYCSWVCGCGGLAETAGDPYRHLSDKSIKAWKIERWMVHSVLVFVTVMTIAVVYTMLGNDPSQNWFTKDVFLALSAGILTLIFALIMIFKRDQLAKDAKYAAVSFFVVILVIMGISQFSGYHEVFFVPAYFLRETYGFLIGATFSGVIGVGFYPIMGNRVWCRFGCPMAAILGMQQRLFSKFRITVNGGQCISCGNCSTYCEMGIDVRSYAQKGQNVVRSSCVGCGICANVCPRGVLKLENESLDNRINGKDVLLGNDVDLLQMLKKQ